MTLVPGDITIAVTVYSRREYVVQAIESALNQSVPIKVMVVEDCGPDPTLQKFIKAKFGSRIQYQRNPQRRGLFDNWNACLELCPTPWISILHDDDFLKPHFVEAMIELAKNAPDRGFYFGRVGIVDRGNEIPPADFPSSETWREVDLVSFANMNPALFPGQLFRVDRARSLGGFRRASLWAGDWEMWFKLSAAHGSAQTRATVAFARTHSGAERGTSKIERNGRKFALDNVQRKRNLAILKTMGYSALFQRQPPGWPSIPLKFLLQSSANVSPRLLAYNTRLFLGSRPHIWAYALVQFWVRILGPSILRFLSRIWNGLRLGRIIRPKLRGLFLVV